MVANSTGSDEVFRVLREFIAEQDQIIADAQQAKSSCEETLKVLEQKLGSTTGSMAIAPLPTQHIESIKALPSSSTPESSSNGSTSEEKSSGVGGKTDPSPKSATGKSTLQSPAKSAPKSKPQSTSNKATATKAISKATETKSAPKSTPEPTPPSTGAKPTESKSTGTLQRTFDAEKLKKEYAGQDFYDAARSVMQASPDKPFSIEELITAVYGNYTESAFQSARRSIIRRMDFGTRWNYWKRIEKDGVALFQFDPTLTPKRA